ncbi:MAG: hypothetical protein DRO11_00495 [Methanobacteriota archaeon]|nr:MAG: hypothetical protein DRO11_00495 [Euryarchaeota archaeon]
MPGFAWAMVGLESRLGLAVQRLVMFVVVPKLASSPTHGTCEDFMDKRHSNLLILGMSPPTLFTEAGATDKACVRIFFLCSTLCAELFWPLVVAWQLESLPPFSRVWWSGVVLCLLVGGNG